MVKGVHMNIHRLRSIRHERGLAQAAIAVRSGVAVGTLNLIEVHGYEPRPQTKERIAAALGVEVKAIWPDAGQSDSPPAA